MNSVNGTGITILCSFLMFLGIMVMLGISLDRMEASFASIEGATIAGTTVPAVHCQEDEVIWWTGPDALGCVHFEEVK